MRIPSSFAMFVPGALALGGALVLTGCPGPDDNWTDNSCYCDDSGACYDYAGSSCTNSGTSGSAGGSSGATSSSGNASSSGIVGTSSGSTTSSGDIGTSSGNTSSSSSGDIGTSSGNTSSSSSGGIGTSSSSGGIGTSSSSSGGPAPNCSSDAQCGANQTCSAGYCRFECTTAAECKLHDSRLDICDNGICKSE